MNDLIDRQMAIATFHVCAPGIPLKTLSQIFAAIPSAQPTQFNTPNTLKALDCISRQAAIDVMESETVSTNPEHFKSSEKFIKFMDDADIASFGKWQWANGFNTALVATTVQLKKLPSAQLETMYYPQVDGVTPSVIIQPDLQPTCNQLATDCISRQVAISSVIAYNLEDEGDTASLVMILQNLPSAQQEIIFCKGCKHRNTDECPMYYEEWIEYDEGDGFIERDFIPHDRTVSDGFCFKGERREDE